MIPLRPSSIRPWLLTIAALLLMLPSTAAAQATTQADSARVSLWPEYDRSDVLVIYRVVLPSSTELPARVRLLIPPDAPDLIAAAFRSASGELLNASFTQTDGDQADQVDIEVEGTELQIEFYLPLPITGDQRRFSFTWPGGLAAENFAYEVQQPLGATNMVVQPAASSRTTDSLGLTYHLVDLGAQAAADHPEVAFTYDKATSQLSTEALAPPGSLATPAPASGAPLDIRGSLPWIFLVAGAGLIAAGVIYFLRTRSLADPPRARHRVSRSQPTERDRVDASPVFCHNCGTQATSSDRFCRQCGTALRV